MNAKNKYIVAGIGLVLIAGLVTAYSYARKHGHNNNGQQSSNQSFPVAAASSFAEYKDVPVNIHPQVKPYSVSGNFDNISNKAQFINEENPLVDKSMEESLKKNMFVIAPYGDKEFYEQYERNRYVFTPNFITTDSILHNYHLVFDYLLRNLEQEKLYAQVKELDKAMLSASASQYNDAKGTKWESASRRNVAFFAVASKLGNPGVPMPKNVPDEANQELKLINAGAGVDLSPVMNMGLNLPPTEASQEDYSQYKPRGHYTKTDELKAYFQNMMWYGRQTFRFKNDDDVRSAILITLALDKNNNGQTWTNVYDPTSFFVGVSDDITYYQFRDVVSKIYGNNPTIADVASDNIKFNQVLEAVKNLEAPKINSIPIFDPSINPDREKEIKGFRVMGQRFTIDASVFQKLIYRDVKEDSKGKLRTLPKGLDIPAAMGSKEAYGILQSEGDTDFQGYKENMTLIQDNIQKLDKKTWTQNLYWGWLYSLLSLNEPKGQGYPSLMQSQAWTRKNLNTYLGSFTELKHDTLLYSKQSYAEAGGGGDIPEYDDRGYVEPEPYVYARLASLLQMTKDGLQNRNLLTDKSANNLSKMFDMAVTLKNISEKELNGDKISDADYDFIRGYGAQLEHFWLEANQEDIDRTGMTQRDYLDKNPAGIVADVATDARNGYVLEEGNGRVHPIIVIVPVEGKLKFAVGAVYSHYEFKQPISERLTDEEWTKMQDDDKLPPLPNWMSSYYSK